ncbi:hypothetical protein C8R48DRAFT_669670 [Suillus tomentosus]|nr:hypothetical protein C8R48DRAFT_669670 [Suillus tomentosus]
MPLAKEDKMLLADDKMQPVEDKTLLVDDKMRPVEGKILRLVEELPTEADYRGRGTVMEEEVGRIVGKPLLSLGVPSQGLGEPVFNFLIWQFYQISSNSSYILSESFLIVCPHLHLVSQSFGLPSRQTNVAWVTSRHPALPGCLTTSQMVLLPASTPNLQHGVTSPIRTSVHPSSTKVFRILTTDQQPKLNLIAQSFGLPSRQTNFAWVTSRHPALPGCLTTSQMVLPASTPNLQHGVTSPVRTSVHPSSTKARVPQSKFNLIAQSFGVDWADYS